MGWMDDIPITWKGLEPGFILKSGHREEALGLHGDFDICQGRLACLIGPQGSGKCTVLKLFGGMTLRKSAGQGEGDPVSNVFVPAHVRTLYASKAAFLCDTMLKNLSFGTSG